jgi:hypothetical protein
MVRVEREARGEDRLMSTEEAKNMRAGWLSESIFDLAHSVTAPGLTGHDAAGGTVASLTEAVMGITAGLFAIAAALERIADENR